MIRVEFLKVIHLDALDEFDAVFTNIPTFKNSIVKDITANGATLFHGFLLIKYAADFVCSINLNREYGESKK